MLSVATVILPDFLILDYSMVMPVLRNNYFKLICSYDLRDWLKAEWSNHRRLVYSTVQSNHKFQMYIQLKAFKEGTSELIGSSHSFHRFPPQFTTLTSHELAFK